MPMHTSDTRLEHLDCLSKAGWLAFDVTHMGEPEGYFMSPCCIHGYRAVWGPRPKLEWERANENVWNWTDSAGGDQADYFEREQRAGREGSWVLVAGVQGEIRANELLVAGAKWWVTTQSDADTLEEELYDPLLQQDYAMFGNRYRGPGGDYLGRATRWRHEEHWHSRGSYFPNLRRWTPAHENSSFDGDTAVYGGEAQGSYRGRGGIEDPGLGESSGLPRPSLGFAADSIYWIRYGNRPFLGINKCSDPIGANQERDDHHTHGSGSNWRGVGLDYPDLDIVNPGFSAQGGYVPNLILWGGDVRGAMVKPRVNAQGDILPEVDIVDPGVTVISDITTDSIEPPNVEVSMPGHYNNFQATATISTDPDEIKAVLPGLFKTKSEILAEICDGYNDPIAQTFLVNGMAHPDGVFIRDIDICFQSKPNWGTHIPVILELRPTVNGFPDSEYVIASKELSPSQVNVASGIPFADNPMPAWASPIEHDMGGAVYEARKAVSFPNFTQEYAYTKFEFKYPVHLTPGEYAIVVRSNDSLYKCWIADTRGEVVNSDTALQQFDDEGYEKVSATYARQYGGSFFRSQNGRTWSPDQYQDLMFRINQCDFGGTSQTPETGSLTIGGSQKTADFQYDRLKLNMFSAKTPNEESTSITGTVRAQKNSDSEGTLSEVTGESGNLFTSKEEPRTRDMPVPMKYYADRSAKESSLQMDITLTTKNSDVSPVIDTRNIYAIPIQNNIDGGSLKASDIKLTSVSEGDYSINEKFDITGGGSTESAVINITSTDADGRIEAWEITNGGKNFHKSNITVTPQAGVGGSGATWQVLSEEGKTAGNSKARYVTRPITLAPGMSARAVKVFLTAQEPYQSQIYVYYKALAEEDSEDIKSKNWKLMKRTTPDSDLFQGTQSSFVGPGAISGGVNEYVFDTDELVSYTTDDGNTYDSFKTFAVKVVMFAQNTAHPPVIKDFRAIAVF